VLTLPAALAAHLAQAATSLTVCYRVTKSTGEVLRGTAHDRDITIDLGARAGTYRARSAVFATDIRSTSDGSVSNLDVEGALRVDADVDELTVEEIEAGVYDQAPAELFLLNWTAPNDGQKVLCAGTLGEFQRDSDGRYRSEVRGTAQALSQQIVRTYSERCDVLLFGDARCKFNVAAVTRTGTVTAVTDRRSFVATLDAGPAPIGDTYYAGGRLEFTSGANDGFIREVKSVALVGLVATVELWDEAAADIAIGNTFALPPGCDRTFSTCRDVFDNLVNFRGFGVFATGRDKLMKGVS
jgi:uncharacterized phage protein (TIGR02218 family)